MKTPLFGFLTLIATVLHPSPCHGAEEPEEPRLYLLQPERVRELREAFRNGSRSGNPETRAMVTKILGEADKVLPHPLFTVATNTAKIRIIRGQDPHDYFSLAPYFWPDPEKPDGIPYIHRDGVRNPEKDLVSDNLEISRMVSAVRHLSLAYHITGDEKYARGAARFLRGFFLDPATRMNPNMEHAQAIMGVNSGRGSGMIDVFCLSYLPDCITLIAPSHSWSNKDARGMRRWWHDYADWLRTSPKGGAEARNPNNHGFYYDLQLSCVLLGAGDPGEARKHLLAHLAERLDRQITPSGEMPREEARPTSWHYCNYAVTGICYAGTVARCLGIDIWTHRAPDGSGSIRKAMLFLVPFIDHGTAWKFREIGSFSAAKCRPWLGIGSAVYDDPEIRAAQARYAPMGGLPLQEWLLVPGSR
jgi:Alginate lyase